VTQYDVLPGPVAGAGLGLDGGGQTEADPGRRLPGVGLSGVPGGQAW
jgi:hypothetical protein